MEKIFHSPITTQRHRELGTCEDSDFATIELIELLPEEKVLIVSFEGYEKKREFIEFEGHAYSKMNAGSYFGGMSREDEAVWTKKQGKFSRKLAIKLLLTIREHIDNQFSCISSEKFILIGKTLYARYSKISDLTITICGNMSFAHWLSIDIEAHGNKTTVKLNKTNFDKTVKEQFARWKKGDPKATSIDGRMHSCFSKPLKVKWGEKYAK